MRGHLQRFSIFANILAFNMRPKDLFFIALAVFGSVICENITDIALNDEIDYLENENSSLPNIERNVKSEPIAEQDNNTELPSTLDYNNETVPTEVDSASSADKSNNDTIHLSPRTWSTTNSTAQEAAQGINETDATGEDLKPCKGKLLAPPEWSIASRIKKCCEIGENLHYSSVNDTGFCAAENFPFHVDVITANFYDDGCIVDTEEKTELWVEAINPCNYSIEFNTDIGDLIYVIQNGSLLVMDAGRTASYEIFDDYCLDMDYRTGALTAIVCVSSYRSHVTGSLTVGYAVCLVMSIVCLVVVCFLHIRIKELRTIHGLSFASLSLCLMAGFMFNAIAQISSAAEARLGYAVQYFLLAYFSWLLVLCTNVGIHVWFYIRLYKPMSMVTRRLLFTSYIVFAMSVPLILVLVTKSKGLSGMPSYFYQGWSPSLQDNQRFFIPPVSGILFTCFILLIVCFFGFRQLESILSTRLRIQYQTIDVNGVDTTDLPRIDRELLEKTKQDAKNISYLTVVLIVLWLFEIITFYNPAAGSFLAVMDVLNALQGVFILVVLISVRTQRQIIISWWYDRGSHDCLPPEQTDVEMKTIK